VQEAIQFDRELVTSTALRFQVRPPDAFVALRAVSDARFVQIGRAQEFDPGKRKARTFDLPDEGVFFLLFRREGYGDQVVKVTAKAAAGETVVSVDLGAGARGPNRP
jgi:hypothetical protein